jgi:hypothetical protein
VPRGDVAVELQVRRRVREALADRERLDAAVGSALLDFPRHELLRRLQPGVGQEFQLMRQRVHVRSGWIGRPHLGAPDHRL